MQTTAGRKRLLTPKEELVVSALASIDPGTGRHFTITELHEEVSKMIRPLGRTTIWDILQRTPFPEDKDPSDLFLE